MSETSTFVAGLWGVRYQVKDVARAVAFYTQKLGFQLDQQNLPAFGQVSTGNLKQVLSGPGASGSRPLPDGRTQEPGGSNRIMLQVTNLPERIEALKQAGLQFRNEMEVGPGGKQIQLEDADGNPIECWNLQGASGSAKPRSQPCVGNEKWEGRSSSGTTRLPRPDVGEFRPVGSPCQQGSPACLVAFSGQDERQAAPHRARTRSSHCALRQRELRLGIRPHRRSLSQSRTCRFRSDGGQHSSPLRDPSGTQAEPEYHLEGFHCHPHGRPNRYRLLHCRHQARSRHLLRLVLHSAGIAPRQPRGFDQTSHLRVDGSDGSQRS